jgi:prepilin-type N-terminal cleavage/methylation domain-containing protein
MFNLKRKLSNQKGVTLIELTMTIVIVAIIAGIVGPIFAVTIDAYDLKVRRENLREQSNYVMTRMPREIRRVRSMEDVLTANSTTFEFVDTNDDTIRYRLVGNEIMRQLNGGTEIALADHVTALTFTYYYFANSNVQTAIATPVTGSGTLTDIQMINVEVDFLDGNEDLTMSTQIRPYNFIQESDLFNV